MRIREIKGKLEERERDFGPIEESWRKRREKENQRKGRNERDPS